MRNDKVIWMLVVLLTALANGRCFAGGEGKRDSSLRGEYSVMVYADGGLSYYAAEGGVPDYLETKVYKIWPAATLRVMWNPDHRLSIGLESGWTTVYSYKLLDAPLPGKLSITSVPLLLEFGMKVTPRFMVFGGAGSYFQTTHLDYAGEVSSHSVSLGWMAAGSYTILKFNRLALAAEVKWLNAAEAQQGILCAQIQLAWKCFSW